MTKQELDRWYELMEKWQMAIKIAPLPSEPTTEIHRELLRLNQMIMEISHAIHNNEMLKDY